LAEGVHLAGTYGEGTAQPTFFDLFGFFPGSFTGNPGLKPEKSRGMEVSLRWRGSAASAALTLYRQKLRNEIVDVFDFPLSTTANSTGTSHRKGVEAEANWAASEALRLSANYAYLNASEPDVAVGRVKEQRRPRHSGSVAADGNVGRLQYGAAIAYTGRRVDTDFDNFPARRVSLAPYWLASGRIAYRLSGTVQATVRVANAFGERYQDVVGYRTEGRSVHAGLRLAFGR